jgi:hypothetical protein
MDTRDKLNTKERYLELITLKEKFISDRFEDIKKLEESEKNGQQLYNRPNWEAIKYNFNDILRYRYDIFLAKYSIGEDVQKVKKEYNSLIPLIEKNWKKSNGYVQMVWILSIGIMLEIEDSDFSKLVQIIEKDNPNDYLVDLLIHYRLPIWQGKSDSFMFKRPYQAIREIVSFSAIDNLNGLERMKKYLLKEWYRGHSDSGWYDAHKSKWNIHTGYWSFESGALVKILGLDDSTLKDMPYYPYDMVHWKDETDSNKLRSHSWIID